MKAAVMAQLIFLLGAGTAGAQPAEGTKQRAMQHYQSGLRLFEKKKYVQARAEFAEGYALSHKAGFLFNMAECERLLGDKGQARALYRRYLTDDPQGKLRAEALSRCQELNLGACEVQVARAAPGVAAPAPAAAPVAPPPVTEAPAPAIPAATPTVDVRADYLPPPGGEPPRRESPPFYKRWPLWVGIGAVVVAGSITAAVLATRSSGPSTPSGDLTVDFSK